MPQELISHHHMGRCQKTAVLVIEDESAIRFMVGRWLTMAGFECYMAASCDEALAVLEMHPVQVIVSDICLPDGSGLEFLPVLRDVSPCAAIIMVTGLGDTATAIEALTHGASGYLIKPIAKETVLREVDRALARWQVTIEELCRSQVLENALAMQSWEQQCERERAIHQLVTASSFRDAETGAHIKRTGLFCEVLAETMSCPSDHVQNIRLAAPLHDLGKIGIPDAILRKPAGLTSDEFEVMKTHTSIGWQLLRDSQWSTMQLASEIALFHHERWDGTGYPNGTRGDAIPLAARMLSIVDVYDALTHDRVYRNALDEATALDLMRQGNGTQFDPDLFVIFERSLPQLRDISLEHPDEELYTRGFDPECLLQHA